MHMSIMCMYACTCMSLCSDPGVPICMYVHKPHLHTYFSGCQMLWSFIWSLYFGLAAAVVPTGGLRSQTGGNPVVAAAVVAVLDAVRSYPCRRNGCSRVYYRACDLRRHYQWSGHGPARPVEKGVDGRSSYTFRRKRDLIRELDDLAGPGADDFAAKTLSRRTGVHDSLISKWAKGRAKIFARCLVRGGGRQRKHRTDGGRYPMAEAEVYSEFLWRRRYLRLKTGKLWLMGKMLECLDQPLGAAPFRASMGWCSRFCKRWNISSQCRTNKHKRSVNERLPAIRAFHQYLIYGLQRSEPQRCTKYGRFPPWLMYHMDQVPLPFSPGSKRTLNMIGEACEMLQPGGSGATKRFCTLQVTICADPSRGQKVNIEIYFSGQGTRLSEEEIALYASLDNVTVRWQRKAWCDGVIAMEYLEAFRAQTLEDGEVMLGMDNHSSQCTPLCRAFMDLMSIQHVMTPSNCTDCVSPVDRNVGQAIKLKIAKLYEADYAQNKDQWELGKTEGGLSDPAKRMLVAKWTSAAWRDISDNHHKLIRSAFVKTGFLIAMNGTENDKIELWQKKRGEFYSRGPDGERYQF